MDKAELVRRVHEGEVISRADLTGADLTGADLNGGIFEGCSFRGAVMVGVVMQEATVVGCDLSGVRWTGGDLNKTSLDHCEFVGAVTAIQFLKSHVMPTDLKHVVTFDDCKGGDVQCSIGGGIGGGQAFMHAGGMGGLTNIDGNLAPV